MNWNLPNVKLPKNGSWVTIETSTKHSPKYETAIFNIHDGVNEWFLPSNDDVCEESDVIKWAYIEE